MRRLRSARAGLKGLHAVAESVVFGPLMFLGLLHLASPAALAAVKDPACMAGGLFAALAGVVLATRRDFGFLRAPLAAATAVSLVLVVASALLAQPLGPLFAYAMVGCAALSTLEQLGAVRRGWRPLPYVGPALGLLARPAFAPVAMLAKGLLALSRLVFTPLVLAEARVRAISFPSSLPDGLRDRGARR